MLVKYKKLDGESVFYRVDPNKDSFYSIDNSIYMEHTEPDEGSVTFFLGDPAGEDYASYMCVSLNSKKNEADSGYVAFEIIESEDDDDDAEELKEFILSHRMPQEWSFEADGDYITSGTISFDDVTYDWGNIYNPTVTATAATATDALQRWTTTATNGTAYTRRGML